MHGTRQALLAGMLATDATVPASVATDATVCATPHAAVVQASRVQDLAAARQATIAKVKANSAARLAAFLAA